ncbi:PhoB family transcriptional regulator [Brevibacillus parabrevis]|mgnify:FL=1|uniref:response regulator transcription factor n=1 Tax=Brevibacillus parabrevis TaxID=54914 RepID=UPI0007ABA0EE|nr:response regulator transcription factor [Brevibacillus parabrevis]KZE46219.1 PhoB family transcriptional regulator [Brevibacillus parabrevis]
MKRVLLIEDEQNMARFIELELRHESFSVTVAADGKTGLELALKEEWDLVLLDLMLPEIDGIEVCRAIRERKKTPIIMLTARDSIDDRVSGLDSGADDYIPKPFAIEELLARMRVVFRRQEEQTDLARTKLAFRELVADLEARTVTKAGQTIELTKREYDLLVVFMKNINRVLPRDVLLDTVWGYESAVETNVVDVYVRYLRNKIDSAQEGSYIQSVRGIGYVMRK